jgi:hypothetical protein
VKALAGTLRRFADLFLICALAGGAAAAFFSYHTPTTYTAAAIYLVPASPGQTVSNGTTLTSFDAERFAATYAVVLGNDQQLLAAMSHPLDRRPQELSSHTQAVLLPNTSAVRVTYVGPTRAAVTAYFSTLTGFVQSSTPPTPNIRPGTLRLLQPPKNIVHDGGGTWVAPVAGALAGLLIAYAAAAIRAQSAPRVNTAQDLRAVHGGGVLEIDLADPQTVEALAVRTLQDAPPTAQVAVLAPSGRYLAVTQELGAALQRVAAQARWQSATLDSGAGERLAQEASRSVLVVPRGALVGQAAASLADLRDLGTSDVLIAVPLRPGPRRAKAAPPVAAPDNPAKTSPPDAVEETTALRRARRS